MKLYLFGALGLFAAVTLPAAAQQATDVAPSTQSSGAGVPGKAGSTSGPAVRAPQGHTQSSQTDATGHPQDTTGIQGKPGGKSGPAVGSR